ncbi:unnamed protein product [Ilex paraguariensis]|uniref:Transcription factor MYB60 n=1 Tax=Ilex paraguariensis TaxID=185542 RepID=A0ABC8RXQ4_9AQUA
MGRPPCCDKVGIKKGPWTPEEDIILVSYIQEHGPGNWRSVPTNTGLLRCSKSCRLRWTNYLRPGIKRGNFTPHEEGMIIHLQALLGNKWAAIASYLPQRTDNDIKNYWNTHLKKKINKFHSALDPQMASDSKSCQFVSKSFSDRDIDIPGHASSPRFNQNSSMYASSTENISRLLEGWMRSSPKTTQSEPQEKLHQHVFANSAAATSLHCYRPEVEQEEGDLISNEEFESILSFDNLTSITWEKSSCDSTQKGSQAAATYDDIHGKAHLVQERKQRTEKNPPLMFFEKWLLDESAGQVEEMMELPPMF